MCLTYGERSKSLPGRQALSLFLSGTHVYALISFNLITLFSEKCFPEVVRVGLLIKRSNFRSLKWERKNTNVEEEERNMVLTSSDFVVVRF